MKHNILIVCANYYPEISAELLNSTKNFLKESDITFDDYRKINVPGVFEIPAVIARNIEKYDGVIALGCVIKGKTPHFEFISQATTDAIMKLSIDYKKPIGNGIITCLNKKQAISRSKTKGVEAAEAVLRVLKNF